MVRGDGSGGVTADAGVGSRSGGVQTNWRGMCAFMSSNPRMHILDLILS